MAWNVELLFIRVNESTPLSDLVPDVFAATETVFGFEDATSVMRDPDLCATWHNGWAMVVDVACRLSGLESFLLEASTLGEVFVVQVSGLPVALNGIQQLERLEGNEAFLGALERAARPTDDGESLAWEMMALQTSVSFDGLWNLNFNLFTLT